MLAEVEYKFKDLPAEQLEEEAKKRLRKAEIECRFHWPLEFPGLRGPGRVRCVRLNPPFMGGQLITYRLGKAYRDFLMDNVASGQSGSADVCTYFFLRSIAYLNKVAVRE